MKGEARTRETPIDTVEIWNSERDEWTEGNYSLDDSRAGATFVTLNGKPHLIGGRGMFLVREQGITFPYRQNIPRGVSYKSGHPTGRLSIRKK